MLTIVVPTYYLLLSSIAELAGHSGSASGVPGTAARAGAEAGAAGTDKLAVGIALAVGGHAHALAANAGDRGRGTHDDLLQAVLCDAGLQSLVIHAVESAL